MGGSPLLCLQYSRKGSLLSKWRGSSRLIIQQESPRRIGHPEDFCIGQVSNLFVGQVTKRLPYAGPKQGDLLTVVKIPQPPRVFTRDYVTIEIAIPAQ
jgi:hypothetical protein